ncbi:MAG: hypothetical protein EA393_02035 [Bacteroidetes bacterium]|nr:MAG: hypothetical protein EA393_02035 [Bacteroidota bacterium]
MKMKLLRYIIPAVLFIVSCNNEAIKPQLNLETGQIYYHNLISEASIEQKIMGQDMGVNMTSSAKMSYHVLDKKDDVYEIDVTYEKMAIKMSFPFGDMEVSSESYNEYDIFSQILSKMTGRSFSISMSKNGKISSITGFESIFSDVFDLFSEMPEEEINQIKDQILQSFGDEAFKGNIEMVTAIFPDKDVSRRDKWTIDTRLEALMGGDIHSLYQLKRITDSYYIISGRSHIVTDDDNAHLPLGRMPISYDMQGSMTSEVKLDRETGWVIESSIIQNLSGTTTMKDSSLPQGELSIPMSIKSETTITSP